MKMEKVESYQVYDYKDKVVIIEFQIQEMKYKVGTKTYFRTDKYIDALTWFSIMQKIDEVLKKIFDKSLDWKSHPRGKLEPIQSAMKLKVEYKIIPKEKTKFDLTKFEYELEWFLRIKIFNDSFERVTRSSAVKATTSASAKASFSNEFESFVNSSGQSPDENIILINSQDSIEDKSNKIKKSTSTPLKSRSSDENVEKVAKTSRKGERHTVTSESSEEAKPEKKRQKLEKPPLKKAHTTDSLKQPKLDGWLDASDAQKMASSEQNVTKRKKKPKAEEKEKTPEKPKSQPTGLQINPEQREKLEHFLEHQKEVEAANDLRMEELKDLEILDCHDLTDDQLRETVHNHKEEILTLFATPHRSRTMPIIEHLKYDPLMITTASIITSDQQLLLLKLIESVRPKEEKGMRDDILHEVVLPYMTVIIFKEKYEFPTTKEALDRIQNQEEKKKLFGFGEDDLYDSR